MAKKKVKVGSKKADKADVNVVIRNSSRNSASVGLGRIEKSGGKNEGRVFSIVGLVCAVAGLFIFPILLCPVAIALGFIARSKGDKGLGLAVIILGAVFLALGILLGVLFALMWASGYTA